MKRSLNQCSSGNGHFVLILRCTVEVNPRNIQYMPQIKSAHTEDIGTNNNFRTGINYYRSN